MVRWSAGGDDVDDAAVDGVALPGQLGQLLEEHLKALLWSGYRSRRRHDPIIAGATDKFRSQPKLIWRLLRSATSRWRAASSAVSTWELAATARSAFSAGSVIAAVPLR